MNLMARTLQDTFVCEHPQEALKIFDKLEESEALQLFDQLSERSLIALIKLLPNDDLSVLIEKWENDKKYDVLNRLSPERLAKIYAQFKPNLQEAYEAHIKPGLLREVKEILAYPTDSAGHVMDRRMLVFFEDMTVTEAIESIKYHQKTGIRILFLISKQGILTRMVPVQQLLLENQDQTLLALSKPIPAVIKDTDPLDEVVSQFESTHLTDLPVVNIQGELIGVIKHHALLAASKEELTLDMQTMVGVSKDERALSSVFFSVRKRLPWLEINLLTAFLASAVVGLFENTIAQFTALAVMLPIVAGQSGNTGAQALAVTMRGLTLKEVRISDALMLVFKEAKIGFITGVSVAVTTALGIYLWSRSLGLMIIIFMSMVLSMVLAGISGALVPMVFVKLKMDPAQCSSIVLTTITDVVGFFSFLTIAASLSYLI